LWSEGVKTGEIYGRLIIQYDHHCKNRRKVYGCVKRLKWLRADAVDVCYGWPWIVPYAEVRGQIDQRNRRTSTDVTASEMSNQSLKEGVQEWLNTQS